MVTYAVEQLDDVALKSGPLGQGFDLMSPFVWREGDGYRLMVRGVAWPLGPTDPTGIIAGGGTVRLTKFWFVRKKFGRVSVLYACRR
jgi:hypothetical protein